MEDAVAELRARLERRRIGGAGFDRAEERLRRACLNGTGHLLVTGSNRAEIHAVLSRVLDDVQPLSAIRTLAADADPYATVDRVISAFDAGAATDNYLDRRDALLALLARAAEADKSIFIVVDDADRATVEQLERVRTSLEIAPEATSRLRLVLVGDASLLRKLQEPAASALRTRIASTVTMDDPATTDGPATAPRKTAVSHALTLAAAATVAFCTAVYTMYFVGLMTGGGRGARVASAVNADAAPPSRAAMYALRGDEAFLDSTLRIPVASAPRTRAAAPAPASPAAVVPAPAPVTKPASPSAASSAVAAKAPRPTTKAAAPAPARGSSIDALMKQFR